MTASTADINAWAELLAEFAEAIGAPKSKGSLYTLFFNKAMEGDADGGGTILAAREYKRLGQIRDIGPFLHQYSPPSGEKNTLETPLRLL